MSIRAAEKSMMNSQKTHTHTHRYIYIRMVCLAQKPPHAVGWVWEPKKFSQWGNQDTPDPPTNEGTACCG